MSENSFRIDSTPDGMEDEFQDDLRLGLLLATQAGQFLAQRVASQMDEARRQSQDQAQRAQAEIEAHRAAAHAATRDAGEQTWWDRSTPAQIAGAWHLARGWEVHDEQMSQRAGFIREGLADRYGITDPDRLEVADLVNAARDERAAQVASPLDDAKWKEREFGRYADELAAQRNQLETDLAAPPPRGWKLPVAGLPDLWPTSNLYVANTDEVEQGYQREEWLESRIDALDGLERDARLGQPYAADRADRLTGHGAKPAIGQEWDRAWDTAERREGLRERMVQAGVPPETIRGRMAAETAQGRPVRDAVRTPSRSAGEDDARRVQRQTARRQQARRH